MTTDQGKSSEKTAVLVDYNNSGMLKSREVSFHWWNSEPTSLHYHNFCEFFIVTDGLIVHEINGERQELHRGTLYLIRPEDRHRISALSKSGGIHMNISLTLKKLRQMCDALGIDVEELLYHTKLQIILSPNELDFFVRKAEKISLLHYNEDHNAQVMICELILRAISILYQAKLFSHFDYPEWLTQVLERIHSPEYSGCTANDIYELGGFSAPAMIGYFKKYTGQTVSEYLRNVKLKRACEILEDSDMPIIELSNLLGYASLSHFNRVFKGYTGFTPYAYRKMKARRAGGLPAEKAGD